MDGGGVGGDQGGEGEGDGHANNEERVKHGKHDENLSKSNLKLQGTIKTVSTRLIESFLPSYQVHEI